MDLNKIILDRDFNNLSVNDISALKDILNIQDDLDLNLISQNSNASKLFLNKVFVGRTSVKWYKVADDLLSFEEGCLKKKIESLNIYNECINPDNEIRSTKGLTCIKVNEDIYIARYLVENGIVSDDDGINCFKKNAYKNVVCLFDTKKNLVEIRSSEDVALKLIKHLSTIFNLNFIECNILSTYNGQVERFRNEINGTFTNVKFKPKRIMESNTNDIESLLKILVAVDNFYMVDEYNKNRLIKDLNEIEFETEEISLIELLLSEINKIGMSVHNKSEIDIDNQPIYKLFKNYINNDTCFLNFDYNSKKHSIRIGIKSNTIQFLSYADEAILNYIREKIFRVS